MPLAELDPAGCWTGDSVGVSAEVAGAASRRPTETDSVTPVLAPGAT